MKYRLVCFDLDGTIIDTDSIWYSLHRYFKVDMDLVKRWYRLHDQGRVTYEQWFQEDIKWWNAKGARKKDFLKVAQQLEFIPGAPETIHELKRRKMKLAVISGSLNFVIEAFFPNNPFDHIFVNDIYFDTKGRIAGFKVTPYEYVNKAEGVKHIAEKERIPVSDCVFVGDNSNDIEAVKLCGLGISFNSKSGELDRAADIVIKKKDLREILPHIT